ncbi:hypothetical protein D8Y22_15645 [Salinadaptatus halalkaliphilus]|uniref:Uncharacterized protein n=1 Tax=Salinadaptatus halalkaliphilus TaxID=2419781 RepID=A0A4S3TI95_9EURY|nr:hypothetical protein [Salinadaptatus halalkaliphilus]THE63774.1 hypothetical protein D8Y22_15645 [Salinadaptatus halalkaliphilus]
MTESPIAVSEGVDTNRNERTISSEDGQLETATELSENGTDEYVLVLRHCHLVDYEGYITGSVLDELDQGRCGWIYAGHLRAAKHRCSRIHQ